MKKERIDLIKKIRKLEMQSIKYLNTLVSPFDMLLIDNEYNNTQSLIQSTLMQEIFGDMYEDICWFLYEWTPGMTIEILGGKTYTINTEEDYYKYLETQ